MFQCKMMYSGQHSIVLLLLVVLTFCHATHVLKRDTDIFNQSKSTTEKEQILNSTDKDIPFLTNFVSTTSKGESRKGLFPSTVDTFKQSTFNANTNNTNARIRSWTSTVMSTDSTPLKIEFQLDSYQIEKPSGANEADVVSTTSTVVLKQTTDRNQQNTENENTSVHFSATTNASPERLNNVQDIMLGDSPDSPTINALKSPTPPNEQRKQPTKMSTPYLKIKIPREKYLAPTPVFITTPSLKPAIKIKAVSYRADSVPLKKIPISFTTKSPAGVTKLSESNAACKGIMPPYRSIAANGSYDVRDYPISAWLSTTVITSNRILAELEARNKLQNYFKGDNEKGIVLSRTCPVLTQIKFKGAFLETREKMDEYAVSFYLPWNGNSEIPTPNDSEMLVDIVEERSLYVHSFKAEVWEITDVFLQSEARKLTMELRKQGEPFLSKYFYLASYAKSPVDDENSTYEIWVYATRSRPLDVALAWQPVTEQPLGEISRRTRTRVCKGFECPPFEVLSIHKAGIQKRRYYGARFATYDPEFCTFTKSSIWRAFMPLHLYKHGVNSHFEVIGATRPAGIVHVKEKYAADGNVTKQSCNKTFTVSLYLPKRLHAAPPVAGNSAPRIKITELDDVIVYVQSVGGFLLVPDRIEKEVRLFRARLKEQNLCIRDGEYYLAVYDYITRFHGRLNEIWTIADRCSYSL